MVELGEPKAPSQVCAGVQGWRTAEVWCGSQPEAWMWLSRVLGPQAPHLLEPRGVSQGRGTLSQRTEEEFFPVEISRKGMGKRCRVHTCLPPDS